MAEKVEVAFATSNKQTIMTVSMFENASIQQMIEKSGIQIHFSEIDLSTMGVGVFGKLCSLNQAVNPGDRIEIYRPLQQNPMDARRQRAVSTKNK